MLLHLQILKVSFLQHWSYTTSLCWCLQTHLSSCYLLTSFVPFKLLWNLKCDFLWKFLFRKGQQQRALCVCFLQFPTRMFLLQNEEKITTNFKLCKFATVLIYVKIYVEIFSCRSLLSIYNCNSLWLVVYLWESRIGPQSAGTMPSNLNPSIRPWWDIFQS